MKSKNQNFGALRAWNGGWCIDGNNNIVNFGWRWGL